MLVAPQRRSGSPAQRGQPRALGHTVGTSAFPRTQAPSLRPWRTPGPEGGSLWATGAALPPPEARLEAGTLPYPKAQARLDGELRVSAQARGAHLVCRAERQRLRRSGRRQRALVARTATPETTDPLDRSSGSQVHPGAGGSRIRWHRASHGMKCTMASCDGARRAGKSADTKALRHWHHHRNTG